MSSAACWKDRMRGSLDSYRRRTAGDTLYGFVASSCVKPVSYLGQALITLSAHSYVSMRSASISCLDTVVTVSQYVTQYSLCLPMYLEVPPVHHQDSETTSGSIIPAELGAEALPADGAVTG